MPGLVTSMPILLGAAFTADTYCRLQVGEAFFFLRSQNDQVPFEAAKAHRACNMNDLSSLVLAAAPIMLKTTGGGLVGRSIGRSIKDAYFGVDR